jgi:hypothetical protein
MIWKIRSEKSLEGKQGNRGRHKAINTVKHAAVPWNNGAGILNTKAAF